MRNLNDKLAILGNKIHNKQKIKIAIVGLGSVGNYLLNYLNSCSYKDVEIFVATRNIDKAIKDINISKVAAIIRNGYSKKIYLDNIDLNSVEDIKRFIQNVEPDFIVNASRVYAGLKYGSISWNTIRAYGLWAPLAVCFIKNIMQAHELANSSAIVINTSYSDAVIPWLKSSNMRYPDFGSGNVNHLIPRIKMAVANEINIDEINNIDICLVASHFHDVVISKEGHTEQCEPLIHISYGGKSLNLDMKQIWKECAIAMPSDAKRNMMNASSNFEIIRKILDSINTKQSILIHSPGVCGYIGGYPITINYSQNPIVKFDERYFSLDRMIAFNKKSIYLDGIEGIDGGELFYTDELLKKVKDLFKVDIPKKIKLAESNEVAQFIIDRIIKPNAE